MLLILVFDVITFKIHALTVAYQMANSDTYVLSRMRRQLLENNISGQVCALFIILIFVAYIFIFPHL